eukprot:CAMPEP_0170750266 /NCGR_PEP_ID=MMETSP0437-20130122/10835_1 /TAXON_ID=0 /ORGANISM="Sexangularia sp." /LENGTH=68 /DNA_ID=CAMNT_0011089241 /DNA_START=136 /DNA_END=338 /DNA_ORIENTATION=-
MNDATWSPSLHRQSELSRGTDRREATRSTPPRTPRTPCASRKRDRPADLVSVQGTPGKAAAAAGPQVL